MREGRIGSLRLQGEDAVHFFNSFFYPSAEEIAVHEERISKINSSISVNKTDSGFEAEIDGLDLSFLEEESKEERMEVVFKVTIRLRDNSFCSNQDKKPVYVKVSSSVNNEFDTCRANDILNVAA